MKKLLSIIFLSLCFLFTANAHEIKKDSYFRIITPIELRENKGFNQPVIYSTLLHEGGLELKVIQIGNREYKNNEWGTWLYIITVAPMWVDNGEWIPKYKHYWIFLKDEIQIWDYEEL